MNKIKELIIIFILLLIPMIFISNTSIASETLPNQNLNVSSTTNEIKVSEIVLKGQNLTITKGKKLSLLKIINPTNAKDKSVTWSSSNTSIVSVTNSGVIKGISKGTAKIIAKAKDGSNVKATCTVKVVQLVTNIKLNKNNASINKGSTLKLTTSITPTNANNKTIKWTSSNPKIATVSSTGVVKGISKGKSVIKAETKDGSKKVTSCTVTVKPVEPNIISLSSKDHTVAVGTDFQLQSTIQPQNADNKTVTWTSSNTKIATVSKTGKVHGISVGHVTITATTYNGKKATCIIRVNIPAKSIKLNKTSLALPVGGKETLSVSFNPTNTSSKEITWSSSNPNVISIQNTKKATLTLTAKKEGSSVITAISKYGLKATCTIKVTKALKSPAGFTSKKYDGVKYYESIPKNATENLPLIIFIHGDGEVNNFSKLRTLPIVKYVESNEAYKAGKFIFIAPMITAKNWQISSTEKNKIMNLIKKTVADYKIDKNRIILTGMSSGGQATWDLASKYPYYFAAIVPMSAKTKFAKAEKLVNIPIWGICGDTKDEEPERNRQMRELIAKINKLNGSKKLIKYEVIKGATHGTIQQYYKRQELFKWMLAQSKAQRVYGFSYEKLIN